MADWRKIRPTEPKSWLASLPDEIYDLSDTSHIVRILDAMCGEGGVGSARKTLMLKRLQTSLSETIGYDLDTVYSQLFNLPRLESEEYSYDLGGLLTFEQRQEVTVKDAHYRGRIAKYMKAFMFGGTKLGIKYSAEAALGEECQVIEGREYYQSMGVPNEQPTTQTIGAKDESDYNEYTVIVMRDEPLSADERYRIYQSTQRLRPVDSILTIKSRGDITSDLVFTENNDEYFDVKPVETSSDWWSVVKYVTGRPDWDYGKYESEWVRPNVAIEAPRQFLVNSQEEQNDFTFMATSVSASSEHVGFYNHQHSKLFTSLAEPDATVLAEAKNALSTASSIKYTASFYGGGYVIDWSYPTAYVPELQSYFAETSRSLRYWSSNEALSGGDPEWLSFETKRILPINRISMNISRKPMRITPYLSSAKDENGDRIWVRVVNKDGLPLSYTNRSWGGSSLAGDMNTVEFNFVTARADAVKIEVERLDMPYYKTMPDGAYEEVRFPFSVELSNVSIHYDVFSAKDYMNSSYEDPFGNLVSTELNVMDMNGIGSDDPKYYWLSQPNIGEDSVEYLILDVRRDGKPVQVNFIELDSIYDGCQLNLYSCDGDEYGEWTPYPYNYELRNGRLDIPSRKVSFLKLEFTKLCAIPYHVVTDGIMVKTRRFPLAERQYASSHLSSSYSITGESQLLLSPQELLPETANVYTELGIKDVYQEYEIANKSALETGNDKYFGFLFTSDAYRHTEQSQVSSVYGDDMAIERSLSGTLPTAVPVDEQRVFYKFHEIGKHEYEVSEYERTFDLAYVVGVKNVRCGYTCRIFSAESDVAFYINTVDGRFIADNHGFDLVNDERMQVRTDEELCSLETVDIQTLTQFRTFEFAVNQNPPREIFDHPSDMINEWHGYDSEVESTEFGVSGNVLRAHLPLSGKTGIESENKLIRSKSVAEAQVEIFPNYDGEWVFECVDLYGENVFSMKYDVEGGKWTTLGAVFLPIPGGSWWNSDYNYRVKVPVVGQVVAGQCIFVPCVDFDALAETDLVRSDFKDIRLIFFNGVDCEELDIDITDNMEMWFRVQQDLGKGVKADGRYHFDEEAFVGAYYIYFGNTKETRDPKRDYHHVFDCRNYANFGDTKARGTDFYSENQYIDIDDGYRLSSIKGFLSLEFTPDSPLPAVPEGKVGKAEARYLIDYEDEEMKLQVYTYEKQLTFVIVEHDGYENAFVSKYDPEKPIFSQGQTSHILIEWGERGSQPVYKNGVIDATDKRRRKITVYVDSTDPVECIDNVYDEVRYNGGIY